MTFALVLAALLAVACVLLVALPFLRDPAPPPGAELLAVSYTHLTLPTN